jgi:enoyl-CoA hydratase/carnithine racemase
MTTVTHEIDNDVLHIQLNRPDKLNALNDEMFDELVVVTETARDNPDLAAVVVSGAGRCFCAGLDLGSQRAFASEGSAGRRPFADPADPGSTGRRPGRGQRIVRALRDNPAPVIAAIHGYAIGGGLQIALGADIRIATANVALAFAEIEFGMTVDMGASQLLPRLIGADRALDLLLSGRRITGTEAVQCGLVTRISDDPVGEALEFARQLAGRNKRAVIQDKRLVRLCETSTMEDGMREELSVMSHNIGSPAQVQAVQRYFAGGALGSARRQGEVPSCSLPAFFTGVVNLLAQWRAEAAGKRIVRCGQISGVTTLATALGSTLSGISRVVLPNAFSRVTT